MAHSNRPSSVTHTISPQTKGESDVAARVRDANFMSYYKQKGGQKGGYRYTLLPQIIDINVLIYLKWCPEEAPT